MNSIFYTSVKLSDQYIELNLTLTKGLKSLKKKHDTISIIMKRKGGGWNINPWKNQKTLEVTLPLSGSFRKRGGGGTRRRWGWGSRPPPAGSPRCSPAASARTLWRSEQDFIIKNQVWWRKIHKQILLSRLLLVPDNVNSALIGR